MDFLCRLFSLIASFAIFASMCGCAGDSGVLKDTLKLAFSNTQADITLGQTLNPNFRYLRLVHNDRPVLLVLGFIEPSRTGGSPTEVWYSGQGEVFKLQAGRLIATSGLSRNLLAVRSPDAALWSQWLAMDANASGTYLRERDLMSDYQFGVRDRITVQRIAHPPLARPAGAGDNDWVWLKEQPESSSPSALPAAYFAFARVDIAAKDPQVRYSIQCITNELCFSFQNWTLADQAYAQNRAAALRGKP